MTTVAPGDDAFAWEAFSIPRLPTMCEADVLDIFRREEGRRLPLSLLASFLCAVSICHKPHAYPELVVTAEQLEMLDTTAASVVRTVVSSGMIPRRGLEYAVLLAYEHGRNVDWRVFMAAIDALPADVTPDEAVPSLRDVCLSFVTVDSREMFALGVLVRRWGFTVFVEGWLRRVGGCVDATGMTDNERLLFAEVLCFSGTIALHLHLRD